MEPEVAFRWANAWALAGWLMLVAGLYAPNRWQALLLRLAGRVWPLLLSAAYAAALAAWWGTAPAGSGFASLPAVSSLFSAPGPLLAGWVHYLAFDLFVGRWIVDQALHAGLPRLAVLPCLILTFLFGPVGLLLFFGVQALTARKELHHAD